MDSYKFVRLVERVASLTEAARGEKTMNIEERSAATARALGVDEAEIDFLETQRYCLGGENGRA